MNKKKSSGKLSLNYSTLAENKLVKVVAENIYTIVGSTFSEDFD